MDWDWEESGNMDMDLDRDADIYDLELSQWKKISVLREVKNNYSGACYSYEFACEHGIIDKESIHCEGFGSDYHSIGIIEYLELKIDENNELVCRHRRGILEEHPASFFTQFGRFRSIDHGEFGGALHFPGGSLEGNIQYVFDLGSKVYAIDSLSHMDKGPFLLYQFNKDLTHELLYDTRGEWDDNPRYNLEYARTAVYENTAYICISGDKIVKQTSGDFVWYGQSRILEVKNDCVSKIVILDEEYNFVTNMVKINNLLYIGMDKMIVEINLEDKRSRQLMDLSVEAEKDIIQAEKSNKYK